MTERVVLAYSGGLDTSVAIGWIAERTGAEVIAVAEEEGLPIDVTSRSPYSIDQNLWGRSCETGRLEDIWNAPQDDVYAYTADPAARRDPDELVLSFAEGSPVAIDGRALSPL